MNGTIHIATDTRSATVPVTVRMPGRSAVRTLAGQAVLSMLHSWGTVAAATAYAHMKVACGDSLLYSVRA
jgi:hypothetical protein